MYDDGAPGDDDAGEILYLVDQLEELVGVGKRVPFSGKVMVEEEIFLGLIDQLRVAVPNEIKQAQRVIRERERIIAEAQEEASKILETAKKRVAYLISRSSSSTMSSRPCARASRSWTRRFATPSPCWIKPATASGNNPSAIGHV
jgi:hypothetical protein